MTDTDLTPASPPLLQEVSKRISSEQIADVVEQLLCAETRSRAGTLEPDHRVRMDAVRLLLSYGVGLPTQRTESVIRNVDETESSFMNRIRSSPHLRQALRRALDEAEAADPTLEA